MAAVSTPAPAFAAAPAAAAAAAAAASTPAVRFGEFLLEVIGRAVEGEESCSCTVAALLDSEGFQLTREEACAALEAAVRGELDAPVGYPRGEIVELLLSRPEVITKLCKLDVALLMARILGEQRKPEPGVLISNRQQMMTFLAYRLGFQVASGEGWSVLSNLNNQTLRSLFRTTLAKGERRREDERASRAMSSILGGSAEKLEGCLAQLLTRDPTYRLVVQNPDIMRRVSYVSKWVECGRLIAEVEELYRQILEEIPRRNDQQWKREVASKRAKEQATFLKFNLRFLLMAFDLSAGDRQRLRGRCHYNDLDQMVAREPLPAAAAAAAQAVAESQRVRRREVVGAVRFDEWRNQRVAIPSFSLSENLSADERAEREARESLLSDADEAANQREVERGGGFRHDERG